MIDSANYTRYLIGLYWWTIVLLMLAAILISKGQDVVWINGVHNRFLDEFFKLITHLGEGWIFIPVAAICLFIRYSLSLSVTAMALLHGLVCSIAKHTFSMPRPTAILDHQLLYLVPGVTVHAHNSFPSGHTATIFCFAVLICMMIRHRVASALILLVALLVACSRIYLLQHFLVDVAAGALIGVGSAFFVFYLFDRLQLPSWSGNSLKLSLKRA